MATLRQLKIFVVTAEHKKMSLAAKQLYISQSSISQIISELEKEYGVILFERKARELKITEAGKLLLEKAKSIVNTNEALEADMRNFKSIRPLRIGATMSIGATILTKLVKQFKEEYPDIDITVKVTNTMHIEMLLLNNELDIALVEGIINNPTIVSKNCFVDRLVFICGKESPFFGVNEVAISELEKQTFILREKGSGTRAIFERVMKEFQIDYNVQWESINVGAILSAVENNFGIGVLSEREATKIQTYSIHVFTVKEYDFKRYFYLSSSVNHPVTSQIQNWIDFINSQPEDLA